MKLMNVLLINPILVILIFITIENKNEIFFEKLLNSRLNTSYKDGIIGNKRVKYFLDSTLRFDTISIVKTLSKNEIGFLEGMYLNTTHFALPKLKKNIQKKSKKAEMDIFIHIKEKNSRNKIFKEAEYIVKLFWEYDYKNDELHNFSSFIVEEKRKTPKIGTMRIIFTQSITHLYKIGNKKVGKHEFYFQYLYNPNSLLGDFSFICNPKNGSFLTMQGDIGHAGVITIYSVLE